MTNMSLSGQQRRELQNALIDAFPNTASLERMLAFELDKNLRASLVFSSSENNRAESHQQVKNCIRTRTKFIFSYSGFWSDGRQLNI
ncbi:hypothetical protein RIVM261_077810 [Rivularia sp. IAM M-261]|nr:hypothetical protein RIVM261_077810 [Rivularia sp. IAM M-261]